MIKLRNLTQEDFIALNGLDWSPLKKERDSILMALSVMNGDVSFVAEDEKGALAGFLIGLVGSGGGRAYLDHLFVVEKFRGCGVGSRLLGAFEDACRSKGLKEIWFIAGNAAPFYEKHGYRLDNSFVIDEIADYVWKNKKCRFMRKML